MAFNNWEDSLQDNSIFKVYQYDSEIYTFTIQSFFALQVAGKYSTNNLVSQGIITIVYFNTILFSTWLILELPLDIFLFFDRNIFSMLQCLVLIDVGHHGQKNRFLGFCFCQKMVYKMVWRKPLVVHWIFSRSGCS